MYIRQCLIHFSCFLLGQFSSPEGEKQSNDKDKDKPSHSYVALITQAILSTIDKKMVLGDIYQYIMDNFSYYNNQQRAWRNSIRHNLSLNECFIKAGKADNGKLILSSNS